MLSSAAAQSVQQQRLTLLKSGLFSELVLLDIDQKKAEGEAMDIAHSVPFVRPVNVYAGGYPDLADAGMIVITAGAAQAPGETRIDLVRKNVRIFQSIVPQITQYNRDSILLIVANPVDILTRVTLTLSGFPAQRVIGSGTVLDTARLKYLLGEHLEVDPRNIHAFIIGEHGDTELPVWSSANVSGIPLDNFCEMRGHFDHEASTRRIAEDVKNSAYEINCRKNVRAYYGIAMSVKRICEAIVRDEKSILPVSNMMHGEYGIDQVVLSMPAIIGKDGIETQVPISMNEAEQEKLKASADTLKKVIGELTL